MRIAELLTPTMVFDKIRELENKNQKHNAISVDTLSLIFGQPPFFILQLIYELERLGLVRLNPNAKSGLRRTKFGKVATLA